MRHGTTGRRQRNRGGSNGGRRNNQQRTQVYDSNGPDVRIRGTAHQVAEKYLALAKDSTSIGDSIMAQSYYQYAEHYIRVINEMNGTFDMSRMSYDTSDEDADVDANGNGNGNGGDNDDQDHAEAEVRVRQKSVKPDDKKSELGLPASILGHARSTKEVEAAD